MQREAKSERSRRQVLDAALDLFSHHGFLATSVRDIARAAKVSIGNVYHHFPDKETIFRTLLDEFWAITESRAYPYRRALQNGAFPDNLEMLGFAARDSVEQYRPYIALIYVDVIEFDGTHIRKFYGDMPRRMHEFLTGEGEIERIRRRVGPDVDPVSALLLATRIFFSYFTIEVLFGVKQPFGKNSGDVIRDIAGTLHRGFVCTEKEHQRSIHEVP